MKKIDAIMNNDVKIFGFWVYLMTDLVIFAVLFAVFIVLRNATFGGPSGRELFEVPIVFAETIILLTSSFTCSLVLLEAHRKQKNRVIFWLTMTFALGLSFLALEFYEFSKFINEGANWQRSAFLSSYFSLVGTHGLHISIGLLWILVSIVTILVRGLLSSDVSRIIRLGIYWHFLDIVWIFIFTVVYAMELL